MRTTTSWSVTTVTRSSPSRADHARDRTCLGAQSRQHLWPYRAWVHADVCRLRYGELRAGLIGDAWGCDLPRARGRAALADAGRGTRGAAGLRDLGPDR